MQPPRTRRAERRGIITVIVAVCLVAILAIVALSIDGGRLFDERRKAKAAADAAARGAAVEMLDLVTGANKAASLSTIRASAVQIAAANGYENDGKHSIVEVNIPPRSGPNAGLDGYIEVIVTSIQRRGFSRLLGADPLRVAGRSVGAGTLVTSQGSVLVLNQKKKNALALGKGTSVLQVNGDVAVNSRAKSPLSISKGSQIEAENITLSGGLAGKQLRDLQKRIAGELHTHMPLTDDPFIDLPVPAQGTSRKLSDLKTGSGSNESYNLKPGHYTEDLVFDHNDTVHLDPGIYYLDGKKLDVKGAASFTGDGVMLYSAGKKEVRFQSTGAIHLSPPTSGPYTGVSIFKARNSKGKISFKKDTQLDISGAIYAPSSLVRFQKTDASLGDDEDDSIWDDLESDLDDALSGDDTPSYGSFGGNIVADMLKIDKHSTVRIEGANLRLKRPLFGLVE